MEFDPTRPIWMQLLDEFARRVVVNEWPPGSRIPGVRDLAVEFGTNPNTIQRSLAELERVGLCRSERTSGRFVTEVTSTITDYRSQFAIQVTDEFIGSILGLGLTQDQAQALVTERWLHADQEMEAN